MKRETAERRAARAQARLIEKAEASGYSSGSGRLVRPAPGRAKEKRAKRRAAALRVRLVEKAEASGYSSARGVNPIERAALVASPHLPRAIISDNRPYQTRLEPFEGFHNGLTDWFVLC